MPSGRPAAAGSNLAGRETALLEALWRGDELAAALRAAQAALAARERDFTRAQEEIAELRDIADAAQAALERLRAMAGDAAEIARRDRQLRDTVAAELFRVSLDTAAGRSGRAFGWDAGPRADGRNRRWWGRLSRALRGRGGLSR